MTRAAHQAGELADLLRDRGAQPLLYPCIAIALPEDTDPLDAALRLAVEGGFDWLVVTSANTASALAERIRILSLNPADLAGLQVAAVGAATSQALKTALGIEVNALPDEFHAEALARAVQFQPGTRILLPQADIARAALGQALRERGALVLTVAAYRTVVGSGGVNLPELLARGKVDAITFTSSSTVRNFHQRLLAEGGSADRLSLICTVCIGPATLQTAHEFGLSHAVAPETHTLEALIHTLESCFEVMGNTQESNQPDR